MANHENTHMDGTVIVEHAGEVGVMGNYQVVGHPVPRKDGVEKVTGAAVFGPDVTFPDLLYAAVYQSPPRPRENSVL